MTGERGWCRIVVLLFWSQKKKKKSGEKGGKARGTNERKNEQKREKNAKKERGKKRKIVPVKIERKDRQTETEGQTDG